MRVRWVVASLLCPPLALAALVNVTIDDQLSDKDTDTKIIYFPPGAWNVGQQCQDCAVRPDPQQAYMGTCQRVIKHVYGTSSVSITGTWHDGTFVCCSVLPSHILVLMISNVEEPQFRER
jgi:hypothetical protein